MQLIYGYNTQFTKEKKQNKKPYCLDTFTEDEAMFWLGYTDAAVEGTFKSIDPNEKIWPDQFVFRIVDHF